MFSYDAYGWLSAVAIPGRQTDVEPPPHGARQVGRPFPNWTGRAWVMATYAEPPAPDTRPAQRAAIRAQLDTIDLETDKPRTRRELNLNKVEAKAWLQAKDDEAAVLRAQLAELG